ncbi:hypothetical protein GEMRC1_011227 [Eukaryota sp. GEM-RC1]
MYLTKDELSSISSLLTSHDRFSLIVIDDDRILNQVHYFGQSLILFDCLLNSVNRYVYLFLNDIDEYLMIPKYLQFSDLFDDNTAAVSFGTKKYLTEYCTVHPSNFEIFIFSSPIDLMPIELSLFPECREHKHQHLKFDPEFCVKGKGLRKYIVKPDLIDILFVHSPIAVQGKKIKEVSTRFGLYRHYRGYPRRLRLETQRTPLQDSWEVDWPIPSISVRCSLYHVKKCHTNHSENVLQAYAATDSEEVVIDKLIDHDLTSPQDPKYLVRWLDGTTTWEGRSVENTAAYYAYRRKYIDEPPQARGPATARANSKLDAAWKAQHHKSAPVVARNQHRMKTRNRTSH